MKLEKIKTLLLAADMQRALYFYEEVFGLSRAIESDYWSELSFGDAIVALHGGGDGTRNPTDLSFQVDNIEAACRRIERAGGKILTQPHRRPGEAIVLAVFGDTEGNEVMLTQYVGEG
jgi:predicted enzyme related to lactoylglutathione lyase